MKLVRPDLSLILVESVGKRAAFLQHIVDKLKLQNVRVLNQRMEVLERPHSHSLSVVSRSVADLVSLTRWCRGLWMDSGGQIIVFKGDGVDDEIRRLESRADSLGVKSWNVMRYNPFPHVFQLDHSVLVIIQT